MVFARAVLVVAAAMFAVFGTWLTFEPDRLETWLGVVAADGVGRTEIRAFYGGVELGMAAFALLGLRRRWTAAACLLIVFTMGGAAAARLYGFTQDGSMGSGTLMVLGTELALVVCAGIGARLAAFRTTATGE